MEALTDDRKALPLMLVAGEHARNDMAKEWKQNIEQAGHLGDCEFTGLGELCLHSKTKR